MKNIRVFIRLFFQFLEVNFFYIFKQSCFRNVLKRSVVFHSQIFFNNYVSQRYIQLNFGNRVATFCVTCVAW